MKMKDMYKINTPDGERLFINIISKKEADSLERVFLSNLLQDSIRPINHRPAYQLDGNKVLYRQFSEDIGFVFPTLNNYRMAVRGTTYWSVNIQPTNEENSLIIPNNNFTRIAACFSMNPAVTNNYKKDIVREITEYLPYEGNRFFLLKDGSVIELRYRTTNLSDGEWFPSLKDFDFFYYVLSGKERPKFSI